MSVKVKMHLQALVTCPHCGHRMDLGGQWDAKNDYAAVSAFCRQSKDWKDGLLGRQVDCEKCKESFILDVIVSFEKVGS